MSVWSGLTNKPTQQQALNMGCRCAETLQVKLSLLWCEAFCETPPHKKIWSR